MTLIFGEVDLKTQFHIRWTTKYVPAILRYGEKSTKNTAKQLAELDGGKMLLHKYYYVTCYLGNTAVTREIWASVA